MARAKRKIRVHGDGSVYKRKDGRTAGEFFEEETNKRHIVYGKTEEECWQKIDAKKAEIAKGNTAPDSRMTVEQWGKEWLEHIKKVNYRAKSYSQRRDAIKNWINPSLGGIPIGKLRADQIQKKLITPMLGLGLAPNTIHSYFGALHAMLEDARVRGMIAKNPCEHIALPEVKRVERPILSLETLDLFLGAMGSLAPMAELAAYTGARGGELRALEWKNVNLEERSLLVCKTVSWIEGKFVVGPPKTDSSTRRLSLPQCAVDLLLTIQKEQRVLRLKNGPDWNKLELVFPHKDGGYQKEGTIHRHVKRAAARVGLPNDFTFHCLRHLAVALLIKAGAHPKMIQEICGHSSIEMTMNLYGHLFEGMHREAMNLLDRVFSTARKQKEA